jgi:hypothetical protein
MLKQISVSERAIQRIRRADTHALLIGDDLFSAIVLEIILSDDEKSLE